MRVNFVKIRRKQLGERIFDAITICICDLHFSCDLVDDRQIKLARRLSDDQGAWFAYDEHNADRVRRVLGIRADAPPDGAHEGELQKYKETLESIARTPAPAGDAHIAAMSALGWLRGADPLMAEPCVWSPQA